jgi:hypothetical protein
MKIYRSLIISKYNHVVCYNVVGSVKNYMCEVNLGRRCGVSAQQAILIVKNMFRMKTCDKGVPIFFL